MNAFRNKSALILSLLIVVAILFTACGSKPAEDKPAAGEDNKQTEQTNEQTQGDKQADNSLSGKKIALVMQFNIGTFSAQYIAGVKEQAEKLGGEVTVFASDGDLAKMASNLDAAVNQRFDGILIDHGQPKALEAGVKKAAEAKIPVVVFDADIKVPGVTLLQQDDRQLADMTLEQLAKDIGGKGNIVKVWVAGFAPMERRQESYKAFQAKYPDIKEIAAFGTADKPALDSQSQMEAILKQYPNKGDISAVWATWDEFAKGAVKAIQQAGRTEIKVYGIDMSDEDLQLIQSENSPWVGSAAVDPKDIGRVQVRYLYQKFHGDQTEDTVVLKPSLVLRDALPKDAKVTLADLDKYVEGWGKSEQGYTDWLKELEANGGK